MTSLTKPGARGCGSKRKAGKMYLCVGTSDDGMPISYFVKDPGIPYPFDYHRSPKLMKDDKGINHVYMWVGAQYYKSPWFHIEETARLGLSRLVSNNFPIEELTPGESRIRLIYPYGIPKFEWKNQGIAYVDCHVKNLEPCYGKHYTPNHCPDDQVANYQFCSFGHEDLSGCLANKNQITYLDEEGKFEIDFPSKNNIQFTYTAVMPAISEDIDMSDKKNWQPAILLDLPISHVESPVVGNEELQEKVTNAGYDYFVTPW